MKGSHHATIANNEEDRDDSPVSYRRCMPAGGVLLAFALCAATSRAEDPKPTEATAPNLVKQANAPISSILQLRVQDGFQPEWEDRDGEGNVLSLSVTMPLPRYRLLPFPQLSLLTIPAAVTPPEESTGFGDLRLVNIAVFDVGSSILWGVGPALVFPTASGRRTGQGKWQAGPALAVAFAPRQWLLGLLAQNPISFAGDDDRRDANALFLQPFATYQLSGGWFVRSIPQMLFNWESGKEIVPLDLGVGRVFRLGRQNVSCFVEPYWNAIGQEPAPTWGVTVGVALLYPGFWGP
jgi:hypothetical protein